MKTTGRAKSKNVVSVMNDTFSGRRNQFVNESLKLAADNHRPTTSGFGKQGNRPKPTGRKTGGGF